PGVLLPNHTSRSGSLSARGIDVVDLYRFDVEQRSVVRLAFTASGGPSLALSKLGGAAIGSAARTTVRQTLGPGTYLVKVSVPPRGSGRYKLGLLARVVTKTSISANGER